MAEDAVMRCSGAGHRETVIQKSFQGSALGFNMFESLGIPNCCP